MPPGGAPPAGAGPFRISATAIETALQGGSDVTITTAQAGSSDRGDILVLSPLDWTSASTLRLLADRDLTFAASITTRDGALVGRARDDIEVDASLRSTGTGDIDLRSLATFVVNQSDVRVEAPIETAGSGAIRLDAAGGSVRIGRVNANADGTLTSTGTGDIRVTARDDVTVNADVRATGSGGVSLVAAQGTLATSRPNQALRIATESGALRLEATRGSVRLQRANQPANAGNNIQVISRTGDIDVVAGDDIELIGDGFGGRWVRVRSTSAGDVRLVAGDRILVQGGTAGDTFAEVVAGTGGSVSLEADAIEIRSGASPGRVQAIGEAALRMVANTQTWDGPVQSGLAPLTGGETLVAGAIEAGVQPSFSLADGRSFKLAARAPDGRASSYTSSLPLVVDTSGTGRIDIAAPVSARRIALFSEEQVRLGADLRATGSDATPLVVAAGRAFRNEAGADALGVDDPRGRWLLYVDSFAGLTGDEPAPREFDLYGRFYDDLEPQDVGFAGNRIIYGETPTLTLDRRQPRQDLRHRRGPRLRRRRAAARRQPRHRARRHPDRRQRRGGSGRTGRGQPLCRDGDGPALRAGLPAPHRAGHADRRPRAAARRGRRHPRTYGAGNPPLTARYEGFVLGEDADVLGGALATDATRTSGAGRYAISGDGLTSDNYAITATDGTPDRRPRAAARRGRRRLAHLRRRQPAADRAATRASCSARTRTCSAARLATDAARTSGAGRYVISARRPDQRQLRHHRYRRHASPSTAAPLRVMVDDAPRSYGAGNPRADRPLRGLRARRGRGRPRRRALARPPRDPQPATPAPTSSRHGLSSDNYAITATERHPHRRPGGADRRGRRPARTYGAANPALTARYTGFVLGEDADVLGGALATDAAAHQRRGRYVITGAASQRQLRHHATRAAASPSTRRRCASWSTTPRAATARPTRR